MQEGSNNTSTEVSIVINNYNYDQYLAEAIDSALNQTHQNCEVIIVDDGSTDNSCKIIESYGDQVKPIFKDNGGQASAFNVGIEAAKGDYIVLLDADDTLLPHAVETCLASMHINAIRLCYRLNLMNDGSKISEVKPLGRDGAFMGSLRDALVVGGFFPGMVTSGNFFRLKELKQCVPVPEKNYRISADLYLFCLNAKFGVIQTIPDILGCYRIHGCNHYASSNGRFSMSNKQLANHLENVLNRRDLLISYSKNLSNPAELESFLLPLYGLSTISDARLRGLHDHRLEHWTSCRIIKSLPMAISAQRGFSQKLRSLPTALTILSNELLPHGLANFFYKLFSKLGRLKIRH